MKEKGFWSKRRYLFLFLNVMLLSQQKYSVASFPNVLLDRLQFGFENDREDHQHDDSLGNKKEGF